MPQYKIRIKDLRQGGFQFISVWAANIRKAEEVALDNAKRLLKHDKVELAPVEKRRVDKG